MTVQNQEESLQSDYTSSWGRTGWTRVLNVMAIHAMDIEIIVFTLHLMTWTAFIVKSLQLL